jgi:hypothetical protein
MSYTCSRYKILCWPDLTVGFNVIMLCYCGTQAAGLCLCSSKWPVNVRKECMRDITEISSYVIITFYRNSGSVEYICQNMLHLFPIHCSYSWGWSMSVHELGGHSQFIYHHCSDGMMIWQTSWGHMHSNWCPWSGLWASHPSTHWYIQRIKKLCNHLPPQACCSFAHHSDVVVIAIMAWRKISYSSSSACFQFREGYTAPYLKVLLMLAWGSQDGQA